MGQGNWLAIDPMTGQMLFRCATVAAQTGGTMALPAWRDKAATLARFLMSGDGT